MDSTALLIRFIKIWPICCGEPSMVCWPAARFRLISMLLSPLKNCEPPHKTFCDQFLKTVIFVTVFGFWRADTRKWFYRSLMDQRGVK